METTHPISTPVNDTMECETNFDGISYSKGSSVLKQLIFVAGKDVFKKSLQVYMHRFQYANAEFQDLIDIIAEEVKKTGVDVDIQAWADRWVRSAGLNELQPVIERNEVGEITKFVIRQTPALEAHPTLRDHKIIVELFDETLQTIKQEEVTVQAQSETVLDVFHGIKAACAILNIGDWGYCKVRIDESSFEALKHHLNKITEPLTRQIVYRALWDMVRDIKGSAVEFIEFVIHQIPQETNFGIANYALDISNAALYNYVPTGYAKDELAHRVLEVILEKIRNAPNKQEAVVFQKKAIGMIYHENDVRRALDWVKNDDTGIEGWKLGQLDRWHIIQKYAEISEHAKELVQEELKRDPSDTGRSSELYCQAAYPSAESKREIWEKFINEGEKMSRYDRGDSMSGFNRERQTEVLAEFSDKYFEKIIEIILSKDKEYAKDFCLSLVPNFIDETIVIERLQAIIPNIPADRFDIIRGFKEDIGDRKRFKRGKELSALYLKRGL